MDVGFHSLVGRGKRNIFFLPPPKLSAVVLSWFDTHPQVRRGTFETKMAAHKRNVTRGKGTHKPEAQMDRTYRSFLNMNQSILLLPPGWDASALQGYPPVVCRCYPFTRVSQWRETKSSRVPCLRNQHDGWGLNPWPPDLEFKVLAAQPHMPPHKSAQLWWSYRKIVDCEQSYFQTIFVLVLPE